jgi:hypothetical protein
MAKTHIASDETLKEGLGDIAMSIQLLAYNKRPVFDDDSDRYTDASVAAMIESGCDGLTYGVEFSTGKAVEGTKLGENAKYDAPTPYTFAKAGNDPYLGIGPFRYWEVNGFYDAVGKPHVTAINGDGRFARDGSNGDVWIMTPTLYMREVEGESTIQRWVSDSQTTGYTIEPDGLTERKHRRQFILRAKYPLVIDDAGNAASISRRPVKRFISHDSVITLTRKKGAQYSGKSRYDHMYVLWMFDLKYATKNSQSVFSGCTAHTEQPAITVAGENVSTVTVAASSVSSWPVGSSVMVGSVKTASPDRGATNAHDIVDAARIVFKSVDGDNCVLTLDCGPITTEVGMIVSTCPWHTGACDGLAGDGSPTDPKSGREPFTIQGIELGHGMYEIVEDVAYKNDGGGWKVYASKSTADDKPGIIPANAVVVGDMPGDATEGWKYSLYDKTVNGAMVHVGSGASQTTGTCDGVYKNADTVTGTLECLTIGVLWNRGNAGLRYVNGSGGLSYAGWLCGSRLSGNGQSGGESAAA